MRLIDADEVLKTICQTKLVKWQKAIIWALVDVQKTVDAVPVIRCKDCDWYGIVELKKDGTVDMRYKPSWCFLWRAGMNVDDYCSCAVRREHD